MRKKDVGYIIPEKEERDESRCELAEANANGGLHAHHCDLFFHAHPHAS